MMVSTAKRRLPGAGLPGCACFGPGPYGGTCLGQARIEALDCGMDRLAALA